MGFKKTLFYRLLTGVFATFLACSPLMVQATESTESQLAYAKTIETNSWDHWPMGPAVYAQSAIVMEADTGMDLRSLKVDGGACKNDLMMQMQADITDVQVVRPSCVETTAVGAAYLAGLAVGYWKTKEELIRNQQIDRVFDPRIGAEEREKKVRGWKRAVKYSFGWAAEE